MQQVYLGAPSNQPTGQRWPAGGSACGRAGRTRGRGDIPVQWTTHLYQPVELTALFTGAGLEIVAEQRFLPEPPSRNPQMIIAARRPSG